MTSTQVFHARDFPQPGQRVFPDDYELVAELETDGLDEAYQLTNHIDQEWWLNEGVRKVVDRPVRSTSIGDIVVSNGTVSVVRLAGWSALGCISEAPFTFQAGLLDVEIQNNEREAAPQVD